MAEGLTYAQSLKEYLKIFTMLLVFTVLTVVAAFIHFADPLGWIVGLLIAAAKTAMVIYIFMHIKFDHPYLRFTIAVPLFLFGIMVFAFHVLGI